MSQRYGSTVCQIEFMHAGFRELLESPEVAGFVRRVAEGIAKDAAGAAGLGPESFWADVKNTVKPTSYKYPGRIIAFVDAMNDDARRAQATDKVLKIAAERPRGA